MNIGDKVRAFVTFGDTMPSEYTGRVVWIHPRRIFYVVEFELGERREKVRESYFFRDLPGNPIKYMRSRRDVDRSPA